MVQPLKHGEQCVKRYGGKKAVSDSYIYIPAREMNRRRYRVIQAVKHPSYIA